MILLAEIMVFSICVLMYILYKVRNGGSLIQQQNMFSVVLLQVMLSVIFECASYAVEGHPSVYALILNHFFNIAYFVVSVIAAFNWVRFSGFMMELKFWNQFPKLFVLGLPMLVSVALSLLSFWTGSIYTIDDSNHFARGSLHFIFVLCCDFYIFLCIAMPARRALLKRYYADRYMYWSLASFGVFPLIGAAIQNVYPGIPATSPAIVIAVLLAYTTIQSKLISVDPLTRLNNRNQLNHFLKHKLNGTLAEGKKLYLFVMDMDKFKQINDTFGHVEGDKALCAVSMALKKSCGPRGCFISRFGGDEFNVIVELENDEAAQELAVVIQDAVAKEGNGLRYPLRISVGFATSKEGDNIPDFFARADAKLYENKKAKNVERSR